MTRIIVSDTGPLISLEKIEGGFEFIRKLYDVIIIPPAVLEELTVDFETPKSYLDRHNINDLIEIRIAPQVPLPKDKTRLGPGEVQAISLAKSLKCPLLIEEKLGRKLAHSLNIQFSGIARQVANAYQSQFISKVEATSMLKDLLHTGRINPMIFEIIKAKIF